MRGIPTLFPQTFVLPNSSIVFRLFQCSLFQSKAMKFQQTHMHAAIVVPLTLIPKLMGGVGCPLYATLVVTMDTFGSFVEGL